MPNTRRPVRSAAVPVLIVLALTGGLAGCGSSSSGGSAASGKLTAQDVVSSGSLSGKTAPQVYAAALAAAKTAPAVHLNGTLHQSATQTVGLDLTVVSGQGATGTFVLNGSSVKVVKVGTTVYAQLSSAFLKSQGAMAKVLGPKVAGKWLKADASMAAMSGLGDVSGYADAAGAMSALMPSSATMSLVSGKTVGGQSTVGVRFVAGQRSGTLYVAATGTPYPLMLDSGQIGSVTFSDWGKTVKITAPASGKVVDLSKLSLSALG